MKKELILVVIAFLIMSLSISSQPKGTQTQSEDSFIYTIKLLSSDSNETKIRFLDFSSHISSVYIYNITSNGMIIKTGKFYVIR